MGGMEWREREAGFGGTLAVCSAKVASRLKKKNKRTKRENINLYFFYIYIKMT